MHIVCDILLVATVDKCPFLSQWTKFWMTRCKGISCRQHDTSTTDCSKCSLQCQHGLLGIAYLQQDCRHMYLPSDMPQHCYACFQWCSGTIVCSDMSMFCRHRIDSYLCRIYSVRCYKLNFFFCIFIYGGTLNGAISRMLFKTFCCSYNKTLLF